MTTYQEQLDAITMLAATKLATPSRLYAPHGYGQVQFHRSTHPIRSMFPGNGWGKSVAMGIECNWWLHHKHPYRTTPSRKILAYWFCKQFAQFDAQRTLLQEKCLDGGWEWNEQKHRYVWPNGAELRVWSCDDPNLWEDVQGVAVDLVCFDEEPPLKLWREMYQRRRADRKTEFVMAATATTPGSWMEVEVYRVWKDFHHSLGVDEASAMDKQQHGQIWCWPTGGIDDNPAADEADREWYRQGRWSSEKERTVRLRGGFQNWIGDPVFDEDGMNWLRERRADLAKNLFPRTGTLEAE